MTPDPIMTEVMAAVALARDGDREGGRRRMEALSARFEGDPDPFCECILAHHMADLQDDIADELAWDQRALEAALRCPEADAARHQASIAGFMPSLHVSLAQDYYKAGDFARSREHLAAGREFTHHLADDAYGQLIQGAMERLTKGLERAGV